MDNYKGYYLNHYSDLHYFEGGAHFKYSDLYYRLDKLVRKLTTEFKGDDSNKGKENISLSRNAKRVIKSYSQKQLENNEGCGYTNDYPQFNLKNNNNQKQSNKKKDSIKSNHHLRTKSEDLNPENELIHINFIINKYESCLHGKTPNNAKILNSTRNSIGLQMKQSSNKINNNISQQNKFLLPIPNTTSYSTKNMFVKKALHNKKTTCSLIKVYNNNSNNNNSSLQDMYLNDDHNHNEQSCLDHDNCTYIKDKKDECFNKFIKFNTNNSCLNFNANANCNGRDSGNENSNTIIIKPQINFSFVNNINDCNLQHQSNESRNKLKEVNNFNPLSKTNNNLISLYREGNDCLRSNIKSKQIPMQINPLKKTHSNFDITNGYGYKTNNKFNQFNLMQQKKTISVQKSSLPDNNHNKSKVKRDNMSQSNFFIKNNKIDLTHQSLNRNKDIMYQSKDLQLIGGIGNETGGDIKIDNNYKNNNNSSSMSSTRNLISYSKNISAYASNVYKMDNYLRKNRNLS